MSFSRYLKWSPFLALTLLNLSGLVNPVHADGGMSGGGGDASEVRVNEIRADILNWISQGGAQGLSLPQAMSLEAYQSEMAAVLIPSAVIVGFVTSAEEASTSNPELKVIVDGQPKTCRGFVSSQDRAKHILCNVERFASTSQMDQYRLIHHEYAGLAGVEQNQGAASDYAISTQLTQFLVPEVVMRLAIRPRNNAPRSRGDRRVFGRHQLVSDLSVLADAPLGEERCSEILELRDLGDQVEIIQGADSLIIPKSSGIQFGRRGGYRYEWSMRHPTIISWFETRVYGESYFMGSMPLHIELDVFSVSGRTALGRALRRKRLVNTRTYHFEYNPDSQLLSYTLSRQGVSRSCVYRRL